ncbi:MAG: PEP-CTERM sorting domain-containing protein [Thiobacillaceae bacterium]
MFTFKKSALAMALAGLGIAGGAHAAAVTGMDLADVFVAGSASNGSADTLGTDGIVGAFKFSTTGDINLSTYGAASLFGPTGGGVISTTGASAPGSFTTGFLFAGAPFVPETFAAVVATTNAAADAAAIGTSLPGTDLTFTNFSWGGNYAGAYTFHLTPGTVVGAGTPDLLQVDQLVKVGANTYDYLIRFGSQITTAGDPSGGKFAGQYTRWALEGQITTAAAVPEASTYGMMVAGLGLVGVAARRRRNKAK